jgi:hypothetical protein
MEEQNQQLRGVTADVLASARELRKGTIERVLGMSDLELGLQVLLANRSSGSRKTHPQHCVQYATVHFYADGPSAPCLTDNRRSVLYRREVICGGERRPVGSGERSAGRAHNGRDREPTCPASVQHIRLSNRLVLSDVLAAERTSWWLCYRAGLLTCTTSFPKFSPRNSIPRASGAWSIPSRICSRWRNCPSRWRAASQIRASSYRS